METSKYNQKKQGTRLAFEKNGVGDLLIQFSPAPEVVVQTHPKKKVYWNHPIILVQWIERNISIYNILYYTIYNI
jgi:hypothetical protein